MTRDRRRALISLPAALALIVSLGCGEASSTPAAPGPVDGAVTVGPPAPVEVDVVGPPRPIDIELEPTPDADLHGTTEAERIANAYALIAEMAKAYRAPALVDHVDLEIVMGRQKLDPTSYDFVFGPGRDMAMDKGGSRVFVTGGHVYVEVAMMRDRYLKRPLDGDVMKTLTETFGSYKGILIHERLRHSDDMQQVLEALSLNMPGPVRLVGVRDTTNVDGEPRHQISMVSASGSLAIDVDPATKFVVRAEMVYEDESAPIPNFETRRTFVFHPRRLEALPAPIVYDPGERREVPTPAALFGRLVFADPVVLSVSEGEKLPEIEGHTLEGERLRLSDRVGQVVIMPLWSISSPDSRRGFDGVKDLFAWSAQFGGMVEVLPICTQRTSPNKGEHWEQTYRYWAKHMPEHRTLIDQDNAIMGALGLFGVPVTIVADQQGRLVTAEPGFTPEALQRVKDAVLSTMAGQ